MAKKRIGIIGSTGSIGTQAVDVILQNKNLFEVVFLTAHSNKDLLFHQMEQLSCSCGILTKDDKDGALIKEVLDNEEVDLVLHSPSGIEAVKAAYEIVSRGIDIALANKECIVTAGEIIIDVAEKNNAKIIPVDSEHSAIFQCLLGQRQKSIKNITLTASGGPFRNLSLDEMKNVTIKEALNHPNWSMGKKITIDSATMMNKGLELIEAHYLFKIEASKLQVAVHPESIVHSFVTFTDGSIIAQMGKPSMKVPISFALGFPERIISGVDEPDLFSIGSLNFEKPDFKRFTALKIAIDVLNSGSNALMTAMNAANEAAALAFINNEIPFLSIPKIIEETLSKVTFNNAVSVDEACLNSEKSYDIALSLIAKERK